MGAVRPVADLNRFYSISTLGAFFKRPGRGATPCVTRAFALSTGERGKLSPFDFFPLSMCAVWGRMFPVWKNYGGHHL